VKSLICAAAAVIVSTSPALAELCIGKWGSGSKTSVTFHGGRNLTYCYREQCWDAKFSGSKNAMLSFILVKGGPTLTLVKSGAGYKVTWRHGNQSDKTTITCH